jgi:type I restriction enzyme M protein
MDYWEESMQDDCYLIAADGWVKAAQPQLIIEDKSKKTKAKPDFAIGKKKYSAELFPPALIIARYYAKEQAAIEALEAEIAALEQELDEMAEEHGGEDGLLAEAKNDKDKLTKASAAARLKELRPGNAPGSAKPQLGAKKKAAELGLSAPSADAEEIAALHAYVKLAEQAADTGAKLKTAQEELTAKVAAKYPKLTEDEIKTLVVGDKWLATLAAAVQGELDRVSQTLTGRIRQLAERYASPLPQLTDEVEQLAAKVAVHLEKMGVKA